VRATAIDKVRPFGRSRNHNVRSAIPHGVTVRIPGFLAVAMYFSNSGKNINNVKDVEKCLLTTSANEHSSCSAK
jgi:hypothetical protein